VSDYVLFPKSQSFESNINCVTDKQGVHHEGTENIHKLL